MQNQQKFNLIKKLLCNAVIACFFVITVLEIIYYFNSTNNLYFILNIIIVCLAAVGYIICNIILNTRQLHKVFSCILVFYFLTFMFLMIAKKYNLVSIFNSPQKLKEIIINSGNVGVFIFILVQIAQVIISPIPGAATIFIGAQIYGELFGFIYSTIGILIGSILAFLIGKIFGKTVVTWIVGEANTKKWSSILAKKGKILLPIIFLMPLLPDDIVCIICGSINMSFKYFLIISLITRPIGVFISSYLYGGHLIPFYWPYTLIWVAILIIFISIFILLLKKQNKLESWFLKQINKKRKA